MANTQPKAPPQGRQINTNLMTQGNILKEILLFSIPLILGNLLQQMYNTVDSIIVGNAVGSGALAAVGSGTSLINLIIGFSQGVAVGAGVVISQFLGAENHTGVKKAVHTAITISAFMGVIVTLVGFFFSGTFLQWMGTPTDVLADSTSYLRIYSLGLIFNVLYNMATGVLNAAGNSRRPLLYLGIASGTNIVLDIVFIAVLGMGVQGAALATDISQALSCLLALAYLVRVPAVYRVEPAQLRVDPKIAARIVRIGLPTGIQNMVISFSNVLVQSTVNQFGSKAMAGFTAYMKVDGFDVLPVLSFSMALTTFTGQNYGAGKYDRVKKRHGGHAGDERLLHDRGQCAAADLPRADPAAVHRRRGGHRLWHAGDALPLPVLLAAGHYVRAGRYGARRGTQRPADGDSAVLAVRVPHFLGVDRDPAFFVDRRHLYAVPDHVGHRRFADGAVHVEGKVDAEKVEGCCEGRRGRRPLQHRG